MKCHRKTICPEFALEIAPLIHSGRMHGSASTLGNIVQHVPPSTTHASHDAGALGVALVVKLAFDSLPISLHHLHCSSLSMYASRVI
jgi:hypothetical protein